MSPFDRKAIALFTMSYVLCVGYVPSGHAKDLGCVPRSAAAARIQVSWYLRCTGEEKAYRGTRVGALLFVCCQLGDATLVESVGSVEACVGSDVVGDADGYVECEGLCSPL
jgi:hypothetical protein